MDVIEPLTIVDPRKRPDKTFEYIDVSSVSRDTLSIHQTSTLVGRDAPSRARRLVHTGDVLFATIRPTLQRIALVPDHLDGAVCSTGYFVLRAKADTFGRFLFYYLFSESFYDEMAALQRGASYPAVSDRDVKEHVMALPPLPEQERIVAILDEAFAAIATATTNTEKNLANARELFESYVDDAFSPSGKGWVEKKLGELCVFKNGVNFDRSEKGENGVLTVDVLNMYFDDVSVQLDRLYRVEKNLRPDYLLKEGDILFVRSSVKREGVGWPSTFCGHSEPVTFCGFIIRARAIDSRTYNPALLVYYLRQPKMRERLVDGAKQSTITNISQQLLAEFAVVLPPYCQHKQLLSQFNDLARVRIELESIHQQRLTLLIELKQSILHKAFTGELTADQHTADRILKEASI